MIWYDVNRKYGIWIEYLYRSVATTTQTPQTCQWYGLFIWRYDWGYRNSLVSFSWLNSSVETEYNYEQVILKHRDYLLINQWGFGNDCCLLRTNNLAGNLIGQHGGSGRPSNSDRKAETSWIETRGRGFHAVPRLRQLTLNGTTATTTVATPCVKSSVRRRQQSWSKRHWFIDKLI